MSSKLIGFFQSIAGKADSVLTTKADLATYSTSRIRLGVGSNDTVLTADSSEATGLKWATSTDTNTLDLLDVHTATGTESTYTFTQSLSFDNYSNFIVIVQGGATAALQLQLVINGNTTSNHHYNREYYTGGSVAVTAVADEDFFELASTNIIAGTNAFYAIIEIEMNDNDESYALMRSTSQAYAQLRWERYYGLQGGISTGDLSSITIKTSTSTWIAGTRICTYGYKTA